MKKTTLLVTALLLVNYLSATVYYISPGGNSENSGTDWENALDLSTTSLNKGEAGDEFWVKAGEYQVNIEITNRVLYGGFDGTETELFQRDWVKNKTIIKGVSNATKTLVSMLASAVLDGFIIQDNQNSTANGAGIHLRNRGVVRNSIIRNNSVGGANVGGGIFVDGLIEEEVYPTIENCLVINNACANNGGGVQVANGRALHIINSTVANNKITKNTDTAGSGFGCGIGLPVNATMIAENCIVYNNQKPNADGTENLTFSFGANHAMNNNTISTVRNCAYDAVNPGNGIQNSVVFKEKTDCIDDLSATKIAGFTLPTTFVGSILTTAEEYAEFTTADYSLTATSICIDAGNNTYATAEKDLAGNDRVYNSAIDMGAYEYKPTQTTGINNITSAINFHKANGQLIISGLNNSDNVSIYNALGKIVFSAQSNGNNLLVPLSAKGIYIIKLNDQSQKIIF